MRSSSGYGARSIFIPNIFIFILDSDGLRLILAQFENPTDYELKLLRPSGHICVPPSGWLGFYKEALRVGLRLSIPSFILELFHFMNIPLSLIVPNLFRLIIDFLFICFLFEVWLAIFLFQAFFTIKWHPTIKD